MSIDPVEITVRIVANELEDDELLAVHMAMLTDSKHPENVLGWEKAKPLWDRGPGEPVHSLTKEIVGRLVAERFPR